MDMKNGATAILAIGVGLFLACDGPQNAPDAGPECTLAWVSYRDGVPNIFCADLPGGEVRKLTDLTEGAGRWGISDHGDRVYFGGKEAECWQVFRVRKDGTSLQALTDNAQFDGNPEVSPDGIRLCFITKRWSYAYSDNDLAILSLSGGEPSRLTSHPGNDDSQRWSPDGTKIAFVQTGENGEFSVMAIESRTPFTLTRISPEGYDAYSPCWSPDGAYLYYTLSGTDRRFVAKTDIESPSAFPENISGSQYTAENPAVSPDGSRIAFQAFVDGQWEIATVPSSGGGLTFVAPHSAEDICPCWSPDGSWIFWVSYRDGDREIYGAPANSGATPVRFTNSNGDDIRPLCWAR